MKPESRAFTLSNGPRAVDFTLPRQGVILVEIENAAHE